MIPFLGVILQYEKNDFHVLEADFKACFRTTLAKFSHRALWLEIQNKGKIREIHHFSHLIEKKLSSLIGIIIFHKCVYNRTKFIKIIMLFFFILFL